MRALFLNWRDTKHPAAGGAEYVTQVLAKGLVQAGWTVDWFAAAAPGLAAEETIEGIRVVRQGGPLTVQRAARRWYQAQPKYDFVLDQSHGWPFFAPRWTGVPTMYFIHEITGEVARFMLPWPASWLYRWLEPRFVQQYADVPALTVSQSTKAEMQALGYRAPITVITNSCDVPPLKRLPAVDTKESRLTVVLAARIVPMKRPDQAIRAISVLRQTVPNAQLWIIGKEDPVYRRRLDRLVHTLGAEDGVTFWGFVSYQKKLELLQRAHFATYTSVKEGWGLVVPEANAVGTVGVTYDIPGVRDSNLNGETGLLSPENTPESLAATWAKLYQDPPAYARLRQRAWERVKSITWADANKDFQAAVKAAIKSYPPHAH